MYMLIWAYRIVGILLFFHACWSLIVFRKDEPDPKDMSKIKFWLELIVGIMLFIISFIIKP